MLFFMQTFYLLSFCLLHVFQSFPLFGLSIYLLLKTNKLCETVLPVFNFMRKVVFQLTLALIASWSQKRLFLILSTFSFVWHVLQSSLPNIVLKVWLVHWLEWIWCFFCYLVIWDDDSEMIMMRTKEKRWHCVIRWLSNRKRVWTTTEIFVKNLQSLLSISVIWHAMLSFMGIQYRLPEIS